MITKDGMFRLALAGTVGALMIGGCSDEDAGPIVPDPPGDTADVSMTLTQGLPDGLRDDAVSFVFMVANAGDDSSGAVTVLDTLPGGLTFDGVAVARMSSQPGDEPCVWDDDAGVLRCDFGSLGPDDSHTVTVDVTASSAGTVSHRIWVTEEGEETPSDPITDGADYAGWGTLNVSFDHVVGAADLELDQLQYTNAAGNDYSVRTLLYIVSDVTVFTSTNRTDFGDNMAHYRDAREVSTRTTTIERIPLGDYDFLSFTFGMDEEDNRDPSQGGQWPQTPEWEAMRWPGNWGGGYHYMKLEGDFAVADSSQTFATHTGREHHQTDDTHPSYNNPRPHFVPVDLAMADLEMEDGAVWNVQIVMDVNEWYDNPNVYDLDVYPRAMMMNSDAQDLLEENGQSVFSLGSVELETP